MGAEQRESLSVGALGRRVAMTGQRDFGDENDFRSQADGFAEPEVPYWTHDCAGCRYLGSRAVGKDKYDAYYCLQGVNSPTLLFRYGNEGEYESSVLQFAVIPESQIGGLDRMAPQALADWRTKRVWALELQQQFNLEVR